MLRFLLLFVIFGIGFGVLSRSFRPKDQFPGLPAVMLWSWEHSDDLRFINPQNTGVAFLDKTIFLSREQAASRSRLGQLRYPEGTALMAVVRFESEGKGLPERSVVIQELVGAAETPGIHGLQIDFDARQSERPWYAALLRELRPKLPASIPLSITALASWCERDDWIRNLPVAEACPMFFRMGGAHLTPGNVEVPLCKSSVGVSTDELPVRVQVGRRIFFFHPGKWTPDAYQAAIDQARRWQRR